ncbi:MAG: methyltransferase domain-containing protein [Chitinophagaceae bacterium]|nr:methyltransferase domain-containing protein [Chitinophagaceae bacterium]
MTASLQLQSIERAGYSMQLFVPNPQEVQENYFRQKQENENIPFPHWTRIWPAALAMTDFLYQHPSLTRNKTVLELAAGLGLPSFAAARNATSVCCSDYLDEAVATMQRSAAYLQLSNISCIKLNWNHLPDNCQADIVLLSDVNYDTVEFDALNRTLQRFLQQGATIILSTPQRLMAKPFIEKLLPFCQQQEETIIDDTAVSMFLLKY